MNVNDVWNTLSEIEVGTIAAWIIALTGIFGVGFEVIQKLAKILDKYHNIQEERKEIIAKLDDQNDKFSKAINKLSESVANLDKRLDSIQDGLHVQEEINLKQIRNDIITICDEAIINKRISERKYQLLTELFEEYTTVFHGNGYVADSVEKVKAIWEKEYGGNTEM